MGGKEEPLLPWPPRWVLWVFLLRRLARTLLNPQENGKGSKSPSSSQFRTDRPRLLWCLQLPPSSSRLSRSPTGTGRKSNVKHHGNITMDDIYHVARVMRPRSIAKTFAGT